MEEVFLTSLKINQVRHLHDIEINLSETERKHLILTGKNGSGKTSVLEVLRDYCEGLEKNQVHVEQWKNNLKYNENIINNYPDRLTPAEQSSKQGIIATIDKYARGIAQYSKIDVHIKDYDKLYPSIQDQQFMFVYFPAKRGAKYKEASGPQKLNIHNEPYQIKTNFNENFLQYLVNQKTELSFAQTDSDTKAFESIEKWFADFEGILKEIYGQKVTLEFDRKEWNFYLLLDGYERFDLNHLSDGYAAIIYVISELLLRMGKRGHISHEMQGIVLIDEIETHLHIELQRKILPFLTAFFPKIQFIVTTHSPFVISSISNAVIFDLEKQERVEDMSGYSVESIIESYFDAEQYSDLVKGKVKEYEALSTNANLNKSEKLHLTELEAYFNKFPLSLAPELSLKLNNIRLKKIA